MDGIVVEKQVNLNKTTSLPPWMVGLVVYGGTDPEETEFHLKESAFQARFSPDACHDAWAKVGAAPFTKKCLGNKLVRKLLGDGDEEYELLISYIQEGNNLVTDSLVG
jgi:hypothetical protein